MPQHKPDYRDWVAFKPWDVEHKAIHTGIHRTSPLFASRTELRKWIDAQRSIDC